MKVRSLIISGAVIAAGLVMFNQSYSEDKKASESQMSPEMQAQMAEYMKYAMPGEQHKALEALQGKWTFISKFWMEPGAPAQVSKGTAEVAPVLGGRYFKESVKGEMMGSEFNGMSLTGYDLIKKEYINYWFDDMSTAPMFSTGQQDNSGKIFTFIGKYPDVMQGMKEVTYKTVMKITGADQHVTEMYMVGDDGKEFKHMEITYTRVK